MDSELTATEERIYNVGERLIPGVTHDMAEVIRHRSSYLFFRNVIELDRRRTMSIQSQFEVCILDLGCGVGHGCFEMAETPGVSVVGIDISPETIEYARSHYARENVEYVVSDIVEFVAAMPEFDYVVSRGSLEHVPRGVEVARNSRWRHRLIFDVPYDEPPGANPHHQLHELRGEDMRELENAELFFQDLRGVIYAQRRRRPRPNMILCVSSRDGMPLVTPQIGFPVAAWTPDDWQWPRIWSGSPLFLRLVHRVWLGAGWRLQKLRDRLGRGRLL